MKAKQIATAFLTAIIRIAILVIIVMFIRKLGVMAYGYGYRVFSEEAMTSGDGRDVTVLIPLGSSSMDIGKILENNGLIRDRKLFYIQEKLSSYRGRLKPGTYTLNTSMTAEEMMAVMAQEDEATEGSTEGSAEASGLGTDSQQETAEGTEVTDAAE